MKKSSIYFSVAILFILLWVVSVFSYGKILPIFFAWGFINSCLMAIHHKNKKQ